MKTWLINTAAKTAANSMKSSTKRTSTAGSSRASTTPKALCCLVLDVAGNQEDRLTALKKAAYDFGASQNLSAATAPEAFHRLDDLLLDGMPCDQVNRVRESDDNRIAWDRTMDLHSDFWQGRGDLYYALRQSLVEGILAGTDYTMVSPADGQYEIVKKAA